MRRATWPLMIALVLPACGPAATARPERAISDPAFDTLLRRMGARLDVMHDVARWKWARNAAIEDPERESALLRDVAERGTALGLDPEATRAFFRGQIEAAKVIQKADFRRWESEGRSRGGEAPDLVGVLRPRIDALNRELLESLAEVLPRLADGEARARFRDRAAQLLAGEGIDAEARDAAIGPLIRPGR